MTKLSAPQPAILLRSASREEIVSTLDISLGSGEGLLGNIVEECKVESSAYEWMGLSEIDNRSLTWVINLNIFKRYFEACHKKVYRFAAPFCTIHRLCYYEGLYD